MASTLPIEGYATTREDGVTRIRPVYAAPLPVEAVSSQEYAIPQEPPALPVELPVAQPSGILADVDRALSGAVRAPFDALDERLFGKSGKKGTYREAIQKFFKTGPSDEVKTGVNRLLGTGGEERYKTWPEKLVVDAITAPGNVLKSETPVSTEELIKPALDVSNLAGTGGLAGAGSGAGVALGSGPIKQSGKQLIADVYHGTNKNFDKFELLKNPQGSSGSRESALGHWFTDNPETASSFADWADRGLGGASVIPAKLELKNPLVVNSYDDIKNLVDSFTKFEKPDYIVGGRQIRMRGDKVDYEGLRKDLIAKGYDGIVLKNTLVDSPDGKTPITQYVVFEPNTVKSKLTGQTLFSDNQPSVGIGAVSKSEKPFYSALERSLGSINQNKASGEQWLGMLANKGGVKPDELQWSGISEFLAGKGSVTKAEINNFLKENAFGVQEIVKGGDIQKHKFGTPDEQAAAIRRHAEAREKLYDTPTDSRRYAEVEREYKEAREAMRDIVPGWGRKPDGVDHPTKYHDYQLPGGENYREVLMTLPDKQKRLYEWEYFDPKTQQSKQFKTEAEAKAAAPEGAIVNQKEVAELNPSYKSSHWDEPNILAHMRMNDRTIDGKKSLHLEEIQSDWHQAGRKQGYRSANDPTPKIQEIDKKLSEIRNKEGVTDPLKLYGVNKEYTKLADERAELYKSINNGVPDAPFKKNWHELALKRAIREAAENGYERLSWTPGEAQAARYDLSKQVDKIAVPMVNANGSRSVRIDAKNNTPFKMMVDKNGIVDGSHSAAQFSGKPLSDVVGKEMADKIMKLEKADEFSGDGLKIGGEGMKGFYDNIVPKTIEKLGKQFGVKVQTGKSGKDTIYYIDIPPAMRDKVLAEGFPLFSANVPVIDNDQAR